MSIFNLPDLGEGLPDAEIHEWFVKEGDEVTLDQPLVSMETAKAVVDVPSPQAGIISKFYGKPGDIIKTGEPLVAFVNLEKPVDKGTVVGNLEELNEQDEDIFTIGYKQTHSPRLKATPLVRAYAKKSGIDLAKLVGTGPQGQILREDVERAVAGQKTSLEEGFEPLKGIRRTMLTVMAQSHSQVVPVSLFDEADIDVWKENNDITVRLIRAIIKASATEPALNAWFDTASSARKCFKEVNIGLAMDSEEGLFVPVIHQAEQKDAAALRQSIDSYKKAVGERAVSPENLKGATITLSNFGKFAGRFASPIVVPPTVAILAVGRLYQAVVPCQNSMAIHQLLPLSLSFDHRAVTGGEATRFLKAVMEDLAKPD